MNTRERFLATMVDMDPSVPAMKWEFGYWGGTLNRWYKQGLPKNNYVLTPAEYTTPHASVNTYGFTCKNKYLKGDEYFETMPLTGGALITPQQGYPDEKDVTDFLGMDKHLMGVNVNLHFCPMFEPYTIEEDDDKIIYGDVDGVTRMMLKNGGYPGGEKFTLKPERKSWEKLKEERLNLKDLTKRFPKDWEEKVKEYNNRDYVLGIGGHPHGFFGILAQLMGYDNLFYAYYDEPEILHEMLDHLTTLWISVYEEVLSRVEVDTLHIWEDVSMGTGCMISPDIMKEFMVPYYKRLTGFVKAHGVKVISVDTDGYCMNIIPILMEGGMNCLYPIERHTGMDLREVRHKFPDLRICGGFAHDALSGGRDGIDKALKETEEILKTGGYIPHMDHFVPPDVTLDNFVYYRKKLNDIIDKVARTR